MSRYQEIASDIEKDIIEKKYKEKLPEQFDLAKKGDIDGAREKLKESDKSLLEAHNSQTNMLTKEAQGDHMHVTLLVVHSQDHLMNAITFRDLAGEMVDLYEKLYKSGSLKKED